MDGIKTWDRQNKICIIPEYYKWYQRKQVFRQYTCKWSAALLRSYNCKAVVHNYVHTPAVWEPRGDKIWYQLCPCTGCLRTTWKQSMASICTPAIREHVQTHYGTNSVHTSAVRESCGDKAWYQLCAHTGCQSTRGSNYCTNSVHTLAV